MIVVSDTSPLSALISIRRADLLQLLFGQVLIPSSVQTELLRFHSELPPFLTVQKISDAAAVNALLKQIDRGEAEAIVLAAEARADFLLMDEVAGRQIARERGIPVVGLLGVLVESKRRGLIVCVREILDQLEAETTFFVASHLKARVLTEAGEM